MLDTWIFMEIYVIYSAHSDQFIKRLTLGHGNTNLGWIAGIWLLCQPDDIWKKERGSLMISFEAKEDYERVIWDGIFVFGELCRTAPYRLQQLVLGHQHINHHNEPGCLYIVILSFHSFSHQTTFWYIISIGIWVKGVEEVAIIICGELALRTSTHTLSNLFRTLPVPERLQPMGTWQINTQRLRKHI
jgi:hypothetical protein